MAKKITRVNEGVSDTRSKGYITEKFQPTPEAKSRATNLRAISFALWIAGIGIQIFAILKLLSNEMLTWLLVSIGVILVLVIVANILWKKANRLDPASEKDGIRFFVQNQLGAIMSALAFLPLLILILSNKNMDGKTKTIAGAVAGVALLAATLTGIDFNPPSVEQYTDQIQEVESLTGANFVYWTKSGSRYHLFSDCRYINTDRTTEIFEGTVQEARELKNITELCSSCRTKAEKSKGAEPVSQINEIETISAEE